MLVLVLHLIGNDASREPLPAWTDTISLRIEFSVLDALRAHVGLPGGGSLLWRLLFWRWAHDVDLRCGFGQGWPHVIDVHVVTSKGVGVFLLVLLVLCVGPFVVEVSALDTDDLLALGLRQHPILNA